MLSMCLKWIHHLFSTKTEHKWRTYLKFVSCISAGYIVKICHSIFGSRNLFRRHLLCNHIPYHPDTCQVERYVLPNVDHGCLQYILWIYWRQILKMSFIYSQFLWWTNCGFFCNPSRTFMGFLWEKKAQKYSIFIWGTNRNYFWNKFSLYLHHI